MPAPQDPVGANDVASLVRLLGGTPAPASPVAPLVSTIGQLAGLPVWWHAGSPGTTVAAARRCIRQGKLGLVVGHDPATGSWILVPTMSPVRATWLGVDNRNGPLVRRIRAVGGHPASALAQLLALADALDLDLAGRETFRELRLLVDRGIMLLPRSVTREERHAWILAHLTRLLFLRFVESEGWLDGNPRFLAEAFDRCLIARCDPGRHLLNPLFFGTLNRPWSRRSRLARSFGAVPFLNGGLFEPHGVERRHQFHLPASYWSDAFAALVDRVDVTLDHADDGGRVTPEMLGRVFEGVMEPSERKDDGAFFTPPLLVEAVLRSAITVHLAPLLSRTEARLELDLNDPDPELQRALLHLTVLDPAAGSGAFLVGALHLLHGPGPRQAGRVRRLVTRRLFGVDRNPGAVRVAELRLWLEVLRSARGSAPSAVAPLPNLDVAIRAGDALIDPLHGSSPTERASTILQQRHAAIARVHGADKRNALARLRRSERTALLQAMAQRDRKLVLAIEELQDIAHTPTLFGEEPGLDAPRVRLLREYRAERHALGRQARRIVSDSAAAPFALAAAFAPVLARRGGFDLVVGNPPWVRAERLPLATRNALQQRYRWWRGSHSRGWSHMPDLAVAFIERGYSLLAPGGTLAFLVPAKLTTTGYAATCRAELASRATLHRVVDLGADPRAGFNATIYPLALIASRTPPTSSTIVRFGLDAASTGQPQHRWTGQATWNTADPAVQRLARRLADLYPILGDQATPQLGVKTGINKVFLDPPAPLHRWCRYAVRGRDLTPFHVRPKSRLLWLADERGNPWHEVPAEIAEYLAPWMRALQGRADHGSGPPWRLFRTTAATAAHRVVWRDLATRLTAVFLRDRDVVPLNSCYVAALPSATAAAALTAWLNAAPLRALARIGAEPAAGGCARFGARTISALPLPPTVLTDARLAAWGQSPDPVPQDELDRHVADILHLDRVEMEALNVVATNRR